MDSKHIKFISAHTTDGGLIKVTFDLLSEGRYICRVDRWDNKGKHIEQMYYSADSALEALEKYCVIAVTGDYYLI